MRSKFEDDPERKLGPNASSGLDPRGTAQADHPQGSLTNWLNVPVVRCDRVWLDQSHKVRCPAPFEKKMRGHGRPNLTSVRVGRHQASNESLILAQNQRWRRA